MAALVCLNKPGRRAAKRSMASFKMIKSLDFEQIQQFIENGFVRLDHAFPRKLADEGRQQLWRDTGCNPDDPTTWTQPVIRLADYAQEPFRQAVNMPLLHAAFDQLSALDVGFPAQVLVLSP
jgi:hypothetical protein